MCRHRARLRLLLALWLIIPLAPADTVHVAVASNFAETLHRLAPLFHQQSGHSLKISAASTGKLYAQILHGAPYDVFLAADEERPRLLVEAGRAHGDTLITYARGQLVLWRPSPPQEADIDGTRILRDHRFKRLAIANPQTAPYGVAARETLEALDLWQRLQPEIARGENIAQTFHFVASGAADLGLVAKSQLVGRKAPKGFTWLVPQTLYSPIRQRGVVLQRSRVESAARAFVGFLTGPVAGRVITGEGYLTDDRPG